VLYTLNQNAPNTAAVVTFNATTPFALTQDVQYWVTIVPTQPGSSVAWYVDRNQDDGPMYLATSLNGPWSNNGPDFVPGLRVQADVLSASAVPEPKTSSVFVLGLVGIGGLVLRLRRKLISEK
jgi:hypothetical protein